MMDINEIDIERPEEDALSQIDDYLSSLVTDLKFERNVWSEEQLSTLCPNRDISKFEDILAIEDTKKQFEMIQSIITIMHEGYEFKRRIACKRAHIEYVPFELTKDDLKLLNEEQTMTLLNKALQAFDEDGKVTVVAEPKKNVDQETKST